MADQKRTYTVTTATTPARPRSKARRDGMGLTSGGASAIIESATAGNAQRASHANTADEAAHALRADEAARAATAKTAEHATTADRATAATRADEATHAATATNATTAERANTADTATRAQSAQTADHAATAARAEQAQRATEAETLRTPNYSDGLTTGAGARIDATGNAEFQSMAVRGFFRAAEYQINRIALSEGDVFHTENGLVKSAERQGDGRWKVVLQERFQGDVTGFRVGDILRGAYNGIGTSGGAAEISTSWLRVEAVDAKAGTLTASLYADNQTPEGRNAPPIALMRLARWGNTTDPERQSHIVESATDGRIVRRVKVSAPIVDGAQSDGFVVGKLPAWLREHFGAAVADASDYVFARGIITQNILRYTPAGRPLAERVDRGLWSASARYFYEQQNPETGAFEISRVWHDGALYELARGGNGNTAPAAQSTHWTLIQAKPKDGDAGKNGRGIERVVSFYLLSADSSAPAVSARGWVTAPPKPKKQEPYLWSYDKIYYTDHTSEQTDVRLLAQLGKDGADGLPTRPNLLDGTDFKSAGAWEGYASSKHAKFHTIWRWSPPAISGCNPMGTELFDDIEEGGYSQFSQVLRFDLVEGRSYTFSVYARGVDSGWLIVEPNDGTQFRLVAAKWGEWTRYSVTFRARKPKPGEETRVYLRNWTKDIVRGKKQVVVFCAPKLEEGTEATPWCPSRNDLRGDPGKSSYTHVAYSNSPDGNPCTLAPKGEKFAYLGTYTDENPDASPAPARYVWAKVQGDKGDKGDNGRGIERVEAFYRLTEKNIAPSLRESGWTNTAPQPTKEWPWLWHCELTRYTNGDTTETAVRLIGHYGKDGTNGTSIRAQYSADARTWHDDFAEGDVWMRTGNGTTWGGALRVVGESGADGKSPVYDFAASSQLATASGTTAPTIRGTWQDAPPTLRDGEVLWYRLTAANGKITYGRLSGEKGTSIRAQYSADARTWHDDFAVGDVWMRTGNGTTWGGALRVVGESGADGKSPVYDFAASSQLATASGTTAPTIRGTWQDAPPTLRDGEVLWYRLTAANGKITYGRLSGRNSYIHIAYANSEDGAKDFTLEEDLGRGGEIEFSYFGIYADFDEHASQDNHDYVWTRLRGVDGKDGLTPNANLLDDTDFKNLGRKESAWGVGTFGEEPLGGRANADLFPPSVSGCYPALCSINPGTKQGEFAQLWQNIGRLIPGRTYTFSVYVRGASDAWLIVHPNPSEHFRPNTVKPDEWTRVSLTFTVPKTKATEDTLILLRAWHREEQPYKGFAKNVVWCAPKLEEGGIPTPWNPSRNDLRGNDGAPGARGAVVRQLGDYAKLPDGTAFESGHAGETFQDVVQVRQGAQVQFYQCKQPHTKSADKAPAADSDWWELGMYQGFIATDLFLAKLSLIENLQVENVVGRDANRNITFELDASTGTAYFGGTATFAGFIRRRPVVITPDNWKEYGGELENGVIYLNPFRVGTYVIFRGDFGTLRPTINTGGAPLNDGKKSVTPDDSQAMRYYGAQFMVFNDLEPRPTTLLTVGGLTIGSKQTAIFTMKGHNHADPNLWWHGELLQRW